MRGSGSLGLDLGTSAVRAAELSLAPGGPRLERFVQVGLPPGAISAGVVREPKAVTAALRRLRSVGRFRGTRVALGVANQRVLVRQVAVPWMPPAELRGALAFQVEDVLPFPVQDAVLDYHRVEEFVGEGGSRMLRVFVVAADAAMVRTLLAVVRAAGLRPDVVDLTPFALLRVATLTSPARANGPDAVTEAVLDVGAASTSLVVHSSGVPRFVRILPAGGEDVTEYLAERLGIARNDAEARKRGLDQAAERELDAEHAERQIQQAAIARLVAEICGSLEAYRRQPGARPLSRLVLSGGGTLLGGLPEQLRVATRLTVVPARPISMLSNGSALSVRAVERGDPFAAVPLGLALRLAA